MEEGSNEYWTTLWYDFNLTNLNLVVVDTYALSV